MADLARHLGLARSTVSMALHNHPTISPATRRRVQEAARELGYRANPLVSALMASLQAAHTVRHDTGLALVSDDAGLLERRRQPLLNAIHQGIEDQAAKHGFLLHEFQLGKAGLTPTRIASILHARGIPGVILAPTSPTSLNRFEAWDDFAVITIGWSIADPRLSRSSFHHFQNLLLAWDTLAGRGYRRIGLIHTTEQSEHSGLTYLGGFLARSHTRPVHTRVEPLAVPQAQALTVERVRRWMQAERPDAVIVTDGTCFVPLVQRVASVPDEVAVVALEASAAPAGTAGIDEGSVRVGSLAVDLLIEQLHRNQRGLTDVPSYIYVPGTWREGTTLRAPAPAAA
jgi:DNA-binding LacI/PurR family transcriptional regulator